MKMIYYKLVKITIDVLGLVQVIINVVIRHYNLWDFIVNDWSSVFTSKFWLSLCYFLKIKWRLSTAFYLQTDDQTKRQNNTMKTYFWVFVNFEQNDKVKLLSMAEFAYNNVKNTNIRYMPFKLNCGYHPYTFYKEDVNPCSSQNQKIS